MDRLACILAATGSTGKGPMDQQNYKQAQVYKQAHLLRAPEQQQGGQLGDLVVLGQLEVLGGFHLLKTHAAGVIGLNCGHMAGQQLAGAAPAAGM